MKQTEELKTYIALNAAIIFWGLSFVATKIALESIPLFTLVFARFSLASCFLLIFLIRRGFPEFTGKDHVNMFLIALFEPGLYFIFETLGLKYTTAPKASLIIATIPIVVVILSALFLGEKTRITGLSDLVIYSLLCRNILDRKLKFPAGHLCSEVQRFRGSEVVRHHINPMESIGKEKVRST